MSTISLLTKSSIKMFARNKQALFFTLFSPLIIMVILGLIGFDKIQTFDVGVVTHNPQPATQQIVDQLDKVSVFKIHKGALDEEMKQLNEGNRAVVIDIPDDLVSVGVGQPKQLDLYVNEGQQAQAQAVTSVLNQYLNSVTFAILHVPTLFTLNTQIVDSKNLKYIDFLLPGLIALSIMQMSVFSVAFVFAQYKEKGILKRLLATPMLPYQFVTANVATRLIVSVIQAAIFIAVGVLFLHAQVLGSYLLVALCVILGALMFLGLGFTVSGLAKTVESVPAIANLVVFPMLFLGGTFFDISNMPEWLQKFAKLLPLTYFSTALREVMTKNASLGDIRWDILGMAIWAVILIGLATITFRFQEGENA